MSGNFLYYEKDGVRQDAGLHDDILAGDHTDALDVTRQTLRDKGWSEADIENFVGTGEQIRTGAGTSANTGGDEGEADEAPELDHDLLELSEGAPPSVMAALHAEQKRRNGGKPPPATITDLPVVKDHRMKRTGRRIHLHF